MKSTFVRFGQEQTFAAHKLMSVKCQRTFQTPCPSALNLQSPLYSIFVVRIPRRVASVRSLGDIRLIVAIGIPLPASLRTPRVSKSSFMKALVPEFSSPGPMMMPPGLAGSGSGPGVGPGLGPGFGSGNGNGPGSGSGHGNDCSTLGITIGNTPRSSATSMTELPFGCTPYSFVRRPDFSSNFPEGGIDDCGADDPRIGTCGHQTDVLL